ncbi:ADYC domain-containing protein [Haliangium sp.]|uniref:ADYC domain-containing protein n=1 Tax=Haliangium sp. TaxID=2663208 RepID=UPI003D0ED51D
MTSTRAQPRSLFAPAAFVLAVLPACAGGYDSYGEVSSAITCDVSQCGSNAAELNSLPIGELHLFPGQNTGEVSDWGARVVGFSAPLAAPGGPAGYTMSVVRGRLRATKGSTVLMGAALVGSRISVEDASIDPPLQADLIIHDHDTQMSWTTGAYPAYPIDRYVFITLDHRPVCVDAADTSANNAWAVLLSGERYSWSDKAVIDAGPAAAGWFNIACEDNALYEMKFQGYDPEPALLSLPHTTANERQAALKMITADYCGTGYSFTETGTSLHWLNDALWSDNGAPPASSFEAKWGPTGALCLDNPRLATLAEIASECDLPPPCSEYAGAFEWQTENPM